MFKKTLFKKVIFSALGFVISVLSMFIIINSYSVAKMNKAFVWILFILAFFSVVISILYTFYGLKARRMKGFKGWGYIVVLVYVVLMNILVVYSSISALKDIYSKDIFEYYSVMSFDQNADNFSGSFLFGFIVVITAQICYIVYYAVDFVLTLKNILRVRENNEA